MSYQTDRERFIAIMAREGLPYWAVVQLLREATGIQRRAELACSSEAADRDRVPCPQYRHHLNTSRRKGPCLCDGDHQDGPKAITRIALQDWRAEERIRKVLAEVNAKLYPATEAGEAARLAAHHALWEYTTEGDPRGYTLKVIPPSYAARNVGRDRFNREAVGVPARDSRLRF